MTNDPVGMLLRAVRFAAEKHRTQTRKDPDASPYINHPVSVAELLSSHGVVDIVTLSAAVLHDTIEDTETSAEELQEHFGPEVAGIVLEVTDDKTLPKAVRKEPQVQHAPHLSVGAKLVKLGDLACNAMDVGQRPPSGWDTQRRLDYLDWTERVVAGCRGVNPGLEAYYDEVVTAERRRIGAG